MHDASDHRSPGLPYGIAFAGAFAVGFATLLLEIGLIRVLSFTIWYHFAYVVISTALLGYGAAGTFVAIAPAVGASDLRSALSRAALLAAVSTAGALLFISLFPLQPMEIAKSMPQLLLMLAYMLVATVPFFFSGVAISLTLRAVAERVDRLYFWDLSGAALGCASSVAVMNLLSPPGSVLLAATAFAVASVVFARSRQARLAAAAAGLVLAAASPLGVRIPFTPTDSKHLAKHIFEAKFVPIFMRWGALFRTDVVEDRGLGPEPTWHGEFGTSPTFKGDVQKPRFYIAHDASANAGIYDMSGGDTLEFLTAHVLRLPYLVLPPRPRVLVIGVGGGKDIVAARQFGAESVTGVELDPVAVDVIKNVLVDGVTRVFHDPTVTLVAGEGRHFVKRSGQQFDLIQLTGVDTLAAVFGGAYVLAENYLYTVEAFRDYLAALRPGGLLSLATLELSAGAPRPAGRMVTIAYEALRARGVERPQDHIAVIASTLFAEVMIARDPFTPEQVARLSEFARSDSMQVLYLPDGQAMGSFKGLASTDGTERARLLAEPFDITPTTDDRPFFFRFYHWSRLLNAEPLSPVASTALGQLVLLVLAIALTVLAAILILGPLVVFRWRAVAGGGGQRLGLLAYFVALGLGFMFFEISLLQRFVLFLGYPTYSLSVTLASLLVFLGWGSFLSRRWVGRERRILPLAVLAVALLAVFYQYGLPVVQDRLLGAPLAVRIVFTVGMLAPLGLVLGMFLPLGVRRAAALHPDLVPWAWGVNGCASVTATVLAVVLAMDHGFAWVWNLSVGIYALGVAALLASMRARPTIA